MMRNKLFSRILSFLLFTSLCTSVTVCDAISVERQDDTHDMARTAVLFATVKLGLELGAEVLMPGEEPIFEEARPRLNRYLAAGLAAFQPHLEPFQGHIPHSRLLSTGVEASRLLALWCHKEPSAEESIDEDSLDWSFDTSAVGLAEDDDDLDTEQHASPEDEMSDEDILDDELESEPLTRYQKLRTLRMALSCADWVLSVLPLAIPAATHLGGDDARLITMPYIQTAEVCHTLRSLVRGAHLYSTVGAPSGLTLPAIGLGVVLLGIGTGNYQIASSGVGGMVGVAGLEEVACVASGLQAAHAGVTAEMIIRGDQSFFEKLLLSKDERTLRELKRAAKRPPKEPEWGVPTYIGVCCICLSDFDRGDSIVVFEPCDHHVCPDCYDGLLKDLIKRGNCKCPMCKNRIAAVDTIKSTYTIDAEGKAWDEKGNEVTS